MSKYAATPETSPAAENGPLLPAPSVWRNARLLTFSDPGSRIELLERGAILARGGRIEYAGREADLPRLAGEIEHVDCGGRLVTPALIDCHTHLVFGGHRADEFARRLAGATYEDIARSGGGILSTVRATNSASAEELLAQCLPRLDALLAEGSATVEIKSGYGQNVEGELKMLAVARELATSRPVRVRTSYLAAHAVPPDFAGRADDYITDAVLPG